jgi:ElaB/YqjD/DUF883 family membrane-anchored ribosome-binding protein
MSVENYSSNPSGGHTSETGAIGNPGGSIQQAMDASRNRLSSAYSALQSRSTDVLQGAEGFIQNRPFQAVIYAASVGAVIGFVAGLMLGGERSNTGWYRRWW